MTLLFTDTFAISSAHIVAKWTLTTGTPVANSLPLHTNGRGMTASGGSACTVRKQVAASEEHATFIAGAAFSISGAVSAETPLLDFMSDGATTTHITVSLTGSSAAPARRVRVYLGGLGSTLLTTTPVAYFPVNGVPYFLEAKVVLHDTNGSVVVKIDGVTIIDLQGIDTKAGGTKTVLDGIRLTPGTSSAYDPSISDFYLCNGAGSKNNDFLNAPKIFCLLPNGNGNSSQGTGSDGDSTDNYELVNDPLGFLNTSDYVDFLATGDKDTYTFTDTSGISTANEVFGVGIYAHAQKNDAGARTWVGVARSGSSESDTAAQPLTAATFTAPGGIIETKPGGGAWTVSDLHSMEFGNKAGT